MELHELSIQQAHELLVRREISSEELTQAYFKRIHALDPQIKSFITLCEDSALREAREADKRLMKGEFPHPVDRYTHGCQGFTCDT